MTKKVKAVHRKRKRHRKLTFEKSTTGCEAILQKGITASFFLKLHFFFFFLFQVWFVAYSNQPVRCVGLCLSPDSLSITGVALYQKRQSRSSRKETQTLKSGSIATKERNTEKRKKKEKIKKKSR